MASVRFMVVVDGLAFECSFFGWWLGGFVAGFGRLVVRFLMWWDQVGGSR